MATVICPNCGGENDVTKRGGQECAYCGTMLQYPKSKQKQKDSTFSDSKEFPLSEFIIPIGKDLSTYDNVLYELRKFLISNDSVPVYVFDHLVIKKVEWLYLPMIRYDGRVETEWSCNQVIEKQREVGQRPVRDSKGNIKYYETEYETYYDYLPKSGKGHGSFDVLVPCGKGIELSEGLESCYHRISTIRLDLSLIEPWTNKKQLKPNEAIIDTDLEDLSAKNESIIGQVARVIHDEAQRCSFGNFDKITDTHASYRHELGSATGELYYVPFVRVIYSYKDETHEWVIMQSPSVRTAEPSMPEMDVLDNPVEDMQTLFEEQRKSLSRKEMWSYALSFVFTTLIGCIIFYCRTNRYIEKAKRRLNTQIGLVSLMYKIKRQENLKKYGVMVEIDHNNRDYVEDIATDDDGNLYDWSEKPTTVSEIEEYIEETDRIRKRALRKIRGFWWGFFVLLVLIGGSIWGYNYCDDLQKEKMWAEEQAEAEARQQEIQDEVTAIFNADMIGKTFESYNLYHSGKHIRIKIIDNTKLQYQLGEETNDWDEHLNHVIRWEKPKIVKYRLDVERIKADYGNDLHTSCRLSFDGYKSSNLIKQYAQNEFADEFTIPINKEEQNSYVLPSDNYYLKLKK